MSVLTELKDGAEFAVDLGKKLIAPTNLALHRPERIVNESGKVDKDLLSENQDYVLGAWIRLSLASIAVLVMQGENKDLSLPMAAWGVLFLSTLGATFRRWGIEGQTHKLSIARIKG